MEAQIARIDEEISGTGLRLSAELWAKLGEGAPEQSLLIRGYEGWDALRRKRTAVRVATPYGVVMALGPSGANEENREATELVPALLVLEGGETAYTSGTDLNGDGMPDVVLRNTVGELAIWGILSHGAKRYEIEMGAGATWALDANRDGWVDVGGTYLDPAKTGDVLSPRWEEIAVWEKERGHYTQDSEGARGWHRLKVEALNTQEARAKAGIDYTDAMRLRYALERAWHVGHMGEAERKAAAKELDALKVPDALGEIFRDYRRRLESWMKSVGTARK